MASSGHKLKKEVSTMLTLAWTGTNKTRANPDVACKLLVSEQLLTRNAWENMMSEKIDTTSVKCLLR